MYPNNYRNTSECTWDLSVPRGFKIVLDFLVFDLGASDCATDYITITDLSGNLERTTTHCGKVSLIILYPIIFLNIKKKKNKKWLSNTKIEL